MQSFFFNKKFASNKFRSFRCHTNQFKPNEQVTLEPFERHRACGVGAYRLHKKQKDAAWKVEDMFFFLCYVTLFLKL